MKNTKKWVLLVCGVLLFGATGVLALDSMPVVLSGTGTVTIANTAPTISGIGIHDTVNWVSNLDVNTHYRFYVNVSDTNSINDIQSVSMELYVTSHESDDNSWFHYKFRYTETVVNDSVIAGTWSQILPTTDTWLNAAGCTAPTDPAISSGTYIFDLNGLNKSAAAGTWKFNASVVDGPGASANYGPRAFNVYKYMEMTYNTAAGTNFIWPDAIPGTTDLTTYFNVTVTANTGYILAASYQNTFSNSTTGVTWASEPSIEVKYATANKYLLPNYTAAPPANFVDWSTFSAAAYNQITGHTLMLDIPAMLQRLTYSGVTIYIRATV